MNKHTKPKAMRPAKRGVMAIRDDAQAIAAFRETAKQAERKPSDAAREALRDWTARQQALFGLLALVALFLLPSAAMAADTGAFAVPAGDVSMQHFMRYLFAFDGNASPLASVLKVFNSACLFIAGIYIAHNLIAGTMQTAHDGEMLGKKWSSIWLPIRVALGSAALMPTIGGGFCAAQAVVIWLATLGIGVADAEWNAFAASPATGAGYAAPAQTRAWRTAAENMFLLATCAESMEEYNSWTLEGSPEAQGLGLTRPPQIKALPAGADKWGFYVDTEAGACGSVSLPKLPETDAQDTGDSGVARSLIDVRKLRDGVWPVHQTAALAMWAAADMLAKKQVKGQLSAAELNADLDKATQAYSVAVRAAGDAAAKLTTNDDFVAALQKDGWINAGAFYTKIATAQDTITSAVSLVPSVYVRDTQEWIDGNHGFVAGQMRAAQSHLVGAKLGGVEEIGKPTQNDLMARALGWFLQETRGVNPNGNSQNPVVAAKQFGNALISWAWGGLGTGVAATLAGGVVAGNIAGKIAGADTALLGALQLLTGPLHGLFTTLLLAGITLAVVVPMLPFILWIGVVIGWLLLVLEAIVGAPLWALAHLAPDADGVAGKGGQGYMLILGLTLRPALSILGFVFSIVLMQPLGEWFNEMFMAVFNMSVLQDNASWTTLTITAAGYVVYAGLMVVIINKVFSLSHMIPDQVLRWIGGHTEQLGQHAQEAGSMAKGAIAAGAVGGAMVAQAGQQISGGGKAIAAGLAQRKNEKEQDLAAGARDLEQARGAALNADEKRERNPNSPVAMERQTMDHSRAAGAALRQGARQDHAFAQGLSEAQEKDAETGGTKSVDAFVEAQAKAADAAEAQGQAPSPGQRYAREAHKHMSKAREAMEAAASIAEAVKPEAKPDEPPAGG